MDACPRHALAHDSRSRSRVGPTGSRGVGSAAVAEREFDVVIIGAGPPGEVLAGRVAERGYATAIVESHLVGGECSYYA